MLTKVNIGTNDKSIYPYCSKNIKQFLKNNPHYQGLVIEDYNGKIFKNLKHPIRIVQKFNRKLVSISSHAFQQTNKQLSLQIRQYVSHIVDNCIGNETMLCIGGESYLYGLTSSSRYPINVIHLTNNICIKDDCNFNFTENIDYIGNNKLVFNDVIDYNNIFKELEGKIHYKINYEVQMAVINLANLNLALVKYLNQCNINKIVIINCHHKDFWKKTKHFKNFKLVTRRQFVCYEMHYFITVSVFVRKSGIIPLGNTCSVAYQMNKLGIRNIAYPFDWSSITLTKLNTVLDSNFKDFVSSLGMMKKSTNHPSLNNISKEIVPEGDYSYILKNKHGITFAHEVLKDTPDSFEGFKVALTRRIGRFRNCINPVFVRLENKKINFENYKTLLKLLDEKFTNFKLLVITTLEYDHYQANILNDCNKIKFITVSPEFLNWKYDNIDWKYIMETY